MQQLRVLVCYNQVTKSHKKITKTTTHLDRQGRHDPLHPLVQPAGQDPAPEVVRGPLREGEEGVRARPHQQDPRAQAQDVKLSGMEEVPGGVQEVRLPLLRLRHLQRGQRAPDPGDHPQVLVQT